MHFISVSEADEITWLELSVQQEKMRWAGNSLLLQRNSPEARQVKQQHSSTRIGTGLDSHAKGNTEIPKVYGTTNT